MTVEMLRKRLENVAPGTMVVKSGRDHSYIPVYFAGVVPAHVDVEDRTVTEWGGVDGPQVDVFLLA